MDSKPFVFTLFSCLFIILFLYSKHVSNYIPSKQPNIKVEKSNIDNHLKSNSNEMEASQERDLKQWMVEKENYFRQDKERIQNICKRYNVTRRKLVDEKVVFVDRSHRIATCIIAKVGSTTWKFLFKDMLPSKIREKLTKPLGKDLGIHKQWAMAIKQYYTINQTSVSGRVSNQVAPYLINNFLRSNQILTFSFVRHPFERLVSAYNDKLGSGRIKMKAKFIQEWFKEEVSFSSFVDLVLYQYQESCYPNYTQTSWLRTKWINENCEYKLNAHWRPFGFSCSYCDINYDFIGRLETWNDDLNYIIRKRGLEKVLPLQRAKNLHLHSAKQERYQNTQEMTKAYFSKLNEKQKEALYHMFRIDFEMFNYDPNIYL